MISETIGSGRDHATIAAWEASVNNTDDETGTMMDASDLGGGSNITFNATNSGGYVYLLTADSSVEVDGPTYSAMTTKARSGNRYYVGTTGWVFERHGYTYTGGFLDAAPGGITVRRMCLDSRINAFSGATGTSTVSNCAFITVNACYNGIANKTFKFYHCSALNSTGNATWHRDGATPVIECYGCIGQGSATQFANCIGDWNVSQDATAPGDSGSTYYARSETTSWFESITGGSRDLALNSTYQGWWVAQSKAAISLAGFPTDCDTDIVGTARTGGVDIDPGVWQTPGGGGGGTTVPQGLSSIRTAYGAVRALVDLEVG